MYCRDDWILCGQSIVHVGEGDVKGLLCGNKELWRIWCPIQKRLSRDVQSMEKQWKEMLLPTRILEKIFSTISAIPAGLWLNESLGF